MVLEHRIALRLELHMLEIGRQYLGVLHLHPGDVVEMAFAVGVAAHAVGVRADLPGHPADVRLEALPQFRNGVGRGLRETSTHACDDQGLALFDSHGFDCNVIRDGHVHCLL
ncbi:hypothetical protein D3C80_1771020 [compost metagenome]